MLSRSIAPCSLVYMTGKVVRCYAFAFWFLYPLNVKYSSSKRYSGEISVIWWMSLAFKDAILSVVLVVHASKQAEDHHKIPSSSFRQYL